MKRLLFSGGGTRCILFAQALPLLEAAGHLKNIREYWGTSAGAFFALLLAVGATPTTVQPMIVSTRFQNFRDIDLHNLFAFQTAWGLDDGAALLGELERVLQTVGVSKDVLLRDVPGLHVVVADITTRETLVLSGKTHPHVRAADAVRASMSLPLFYRPYKDPHSGHWWVDGGLRANFAWDLLPSDEEREQTIGMCLVPYDVNRVDTLTQYMISMVHFDEPRKLNEWKERWQHRVLWFPPPPFPPWYFKIDAEDVALMQEIASTVATEWLARLPTRSASETGEIPPSSGPPNTRPSPPHPPSAAESSGSPISSASPRPECPSLQSSQSRPSYRRWSV